MKQASSAGVFSAEGVRPCAPLAESAMPSSVKVACGCLGHESTARCRGRYATARCDAVVMATSGDAAMAWQWCKRPTAKMYHGMQSYSSYSTCTAWLGGSLPSKALSRHTGCMEDLATRYMVARNGGRVDEVAHMYITGHQHVGFRTHRLHGGLGDMVHGCQTWRPGRQGGTKAPGRS